jgi:Ca2+-binding RTX toxin-like protein
MPSSLLPNPFSLSDVGFFSAPTFVDIDNDGDLDAIIGAENGDTLLFTNVGSLSKPVFSLPVVNPFQIQNVAAFMGDTGNPDIPQFDSNPEFVDIDNDGDLDLFVATYPYGNALYYKNIGTANSPKFAAPIINPFGLTNVGEFSSASFVDIDADGDLDAFIGNYPDGNTLFFKNVGNAQNPAFSAPVTNAFGLSNAGIFSSPTFADVDNDGDFDGFVGTESGDILFFQNIGTAQQPSFAAAAANPFGLKNLGTFSSPDFADIDGDGDLDAFVGVESGETFFFENIASGNKQTPQFISFTVTALDNNSPQTTSLGAGNDFVRIAATDARDYTIQTGDGRNIVQAGAGDDLVYGGAGDDVIHGGAGDDVLYSYGGNDVIYGDAGNDTISGGFGNDYLDGGTGIDTVDYRNWSGGASYNLGTGIVQFQNSYAETVVNFENIKTGGGNDYIVGSHAMNVIEAGAGHDTLVGGGGNDRLIGGSGADKFLFESLRDGVDTITDFAWREGDKILIDASSFGASSLSQFSYNYSTGALSFNASPFDSIMPQTFAVLANRPWDFSVRWDVQLV